MKAFNNSHPILCTTTLLFFILHLLLSPASSSSLTNQQLPVSPLSHPFPNFLCYLAIIKMVE